MNQSPLDSQSGKPSWRKSGKRAPKPTKLWNVVRYHGKVKKQTHAWGIPYAMAKAKKRALESLTGMLCCADRSQEIPKGSYFKLEPHEKERKALNIQKAA